MCIGLKDGNHERGLVQTALWQSKEETDAATVYLLGTQPTCE